MQFRPLVLVMVVVVLVAGSTSIRRFDTVSPVYSTATPDLVSPELASEWDPNQPLASPEVPFGFPAPKVFGATWAPLRIAGSPLTPNSHPLDFYSAVYADHYGHTTTIAVIPTYGRYSVTKDALSLTTTLMSATGDAVIPSPTSLDPQRLAQVASPSGCSAVDRVEGQDPVTYQLIGIDRCQSDETQVVIFVVTVGYLTSGDTALSEHGAADFVVDQTILSIQASGGIRQPLALPPA